MDNKGFESLNLESLKHLYGLTILLSVAVVPSLALAFRIITSFSALDTCNPPPPPTLPPTDSPTPEMFFPSLTSFLRFYAESQNVTRLVIANFTRVSGFWFPLSKMSNNVRHHLKKKKEESNVCANNNQIHNVEKAIQTSFF